MCRHAHDNGLYLIIQLELPKIVMILLPFHVDHGHDYFIPIIEHQWYCTIKPYLLKTITDGSFPVSILYVLSWWAMPDYNFNIYVENQIDLPRKFQLDLIYSI